ncbi:Glutamate-cysteine ligase family 2(GCS2) [Halanaeroarchaeum sp. HSR-CO]|uniref:glutamate--cysteine ligase n=1 Tax=Halanaeroarchaeum sp. HSR-CO TaxID=2866382 RepID=UPI00217E634C|nr:glutamate--cysteine ligase [Halanaeroarchaeum sp. HSR-CO]UWG48349.1 Glutamate-cysteine ligase family 2(GCS2) [Halanaeroarchaeum sp. HSR-CO]
MKMGSRAAFTEMGTVGVEEEFFVVDEDGHPVPGSDELVYERDPPSLLRDSIDHELFKFVIETQTPKLSDPGRAPDMIERCRDVLVEYAAESGYRIATAGLHPTADWRDHEHAEKPRYRSQLDRIQYPQHRNTTAGVHVHVGVDDPDKAMWVANETRWYLPLLLALAVNSPFWNGFDTGLASARAKLFEGLPNTGMPTAFDSYAEFDRFEKRMLEHGSIEDRGELWFDVRPHSGHGTVEVRVPDAQVRHDHVVAFVEYVHALVVDLAERYEDGESGTDVRREILDENKWRAIRNGHDASFIEADGSSTIALEAAVDRETDRLGVSALGDVLERESGAERQRRILQERGAGALRESIVL